MRMTLLRIGMLDCQVCAEKSVTDEEIESFAAAHSGISSAVIRREGNPALKGDPERAVCDIDPNRVHVMVDF